jgi:hypothetical protein
MRAHPLVWLWAWVVVEGLAPVPRAQDFSLINNKNREKLLKLTSLIEVAGEFRDRIVLPALLPQPSLWHCLTLCAQSIDRPARSPPVFPHPRPPPPRARAHTHTHTHTHTPHLGHVATPVTPLTSLHRTSPPTAPPPSRTSPHRAL